VREETRLERWLKRKVWLVVMGYPPRKEQLDYYSLGQVLYALSADLRSLWAGMRGRCMTAGCKRWAEGEIPIHRKINNLGWVDLRQELTAIFCGECATRVVLMQWQAMKHRCLHAGYPEIKQKPYEKPGSAL
jgi:hypothetical protein